MEWLLWFSLLLTYIPVTESVKIDESCVSQPTKLLWRQAGESVIIKCNVSPHCPDKDLHYEWFAFKENFPQRLNLSSNSFKYSLDKASLNIRGLHGNDSGIYHCAARSSGDPKPGAQHVGLGTTLIVKVERKTMLRIILWLSLVLLVIYCSAIITFMIKKYGCNMSARNKMSKPDKKNSSKRVQFRDVLQEMYNRRSLDRGKKTPSRNRYSPEQAANPETNGPAEDIYQNV